MESDQLAKVASLRAQGLTQEQMAEHLGVSRSTVARMMKKIKEKTDGLPVGWSEPTEIIPVGNELDLSAMVVVPLDSLQFEQLRESKVVYRSGFKAVEFRKGGIAHSTYFPENWLSEVDWYMSRCDRRGPRLLTYQTVATLSLRHNIPFAERIGRLLRNLEYVSDSLSVRRISAHFQKLRLPNIQFHSSTVLQPFHEWWAESRETLGESIVEQHNRDYSSVIGLRSLARESLGGTEHIEIRDELVQAAINPGSEIPKLLQSVKAALIPESVVLAYMRDLGFEDSEISRALEAKIGNPVTFRLFEQSNLPTYEEFEELQEMGFSTLEERDRYTAIEGYIADLSGTGDAWTKLADGFSPKSQLLQIEALGWTTDALSAAVKLADCFHVNISPEDLKDVEPFIGATIEDTTSSLGYKVLGSLVPNHWTEWLTPEGFDEEVFETTLRVSNGLKIPTEMFDRPGFYAFWAPFTQHIEPHSAYGLPKFHDMELDVSPELIEHLFITGEPYSDATEMIERIVLGLLHERKREQMPLVSLESELCKYLGDFEFAPVIDVLQEKESILIEDDIVLLNTGFEKSKPKRKAAKKGSNQRDIAEPEPAAATTDTSWLQTLGLNPQHIPNFLKRLEGEEPEDAQRLVNAIEESDVSQATGLAWRHLVHVLEDVNPVGEDVPKEERPHTIDRIDAAIGLNKSEKSILHQTRLIRNKMEHPDTICNHKPTWLRINKLLRICDRLEG